MLNLQQPRATSVQAPIVKINKEYTDITGKDNKEAFSNVQQADSSGEHGLGKDHTESLPAGTAEDGFSNVNLSLPDDQQIDSSLESQTGKDHKEGLLAQIADKNDLNTVNMSCSNVQQTDSSGEHGLGKDRTEGLLAGTAKENGFSNVNTSHR